jgi:aryl-alcohol dehydrogenase-like predicted oxidoreductase
VAVIARVPFDEGALTGTLTRESRWPEGDWRNVYYAPQNLEASVARVERLRPLVPDGMTLADLALRFVLSEPTVSTVIPGMRKRAHVEANHTASDAGPLEAGLLDQLAAHRWDGRLEEWE